MQIRNFSIIAHIDHGKSTLSDRLLMRAGAITERESKEQILDDMDLERERGITIKASAVTVFHNHNGEEFMLNFIDTPGHVDFHYEVQKALQACEGAILVVDATQGVQAQTVANAYAAIEVGLEIIPVINKIDLPSARPIEVAEEIEQVLGFRAEDAILVSAKTGQGIDDLIGKLCEQLPAPRGLSDTPTRALIFDSIYDDYRGVIVYCRVVDGELRKGQKIRLMGANKEYQVTDLGKLMPRPKQVERIGTGEVGYFVAAIKDLHDVRVGDTVTDAVTPAAEALPGYRPIQQMVFCDFYPAGETQYEELRDAMDRLQLNDSSFTFTPESSDALGFGFRCGFLGLLHMEIIQERLEREFSIDVVQTAPTVTYEIQMTDGSLKRIDAPSDLPDLTHVMEIREPYILINLILPADSVGAIMKLCEDRRGTYKKTEYIGAARVILQYEIPLAEVIYDFYDKLKSFTRGYGTMDYDIIGFRIGDLVKMDILVNGDKVDALSVIVHRAQAENRGRKLLVRLKAEIDRHLFEIPLQAAIGGKIIARETIKSVGKNVTAKCYGGDVTRKRKLLEKQKEGKKRMKRVGSVDIPQEAFMAILEPGIEAMAEGDNKPTVYVETTIPSYLTAWPSRDMLLASHQNLTKEWWKTAPQQYDLFVSKTVIDEVSRGDAGAVKDRLDLIRSLRVLPDDPSVPELALQYISDLRLPPKAANDAVHLAYAVAFEMTYLLTWNMRHLANSLTMRLLTDVNSARGLHIPLIVTPEYLLQLDEESQP